MIHHLHGKLVDALPSLAVIDVHGVGYEVLIPLSSFDRLPPVGQEVRLLTHLAVREDAHILYGFVTPSERDLFRLLIHTVSGIGPKIALGILSGLSVNAFRSAVAAQDVKALSAVSGVGRKTAERIVVELKDKIAAFGVDTSTPGSPRAVLPEPEARLADAAAALVALGFKPAEAQESVRAAAALLGPDATVEKIVRACLRKPA
jgi:Holliday junction DNA helicase RuvA